jgi:hypothetical protein
VIDVYRELGTVALGPQVVPNSGRRLARNRGSKVLTGIGEFATTTGPVRRGAIPRTPVPTLDISPETAATRSPRLRMSSCASGVCLDRVNRVGGQ